MGNNLIQWETEDLNQLLNLLVGQYYGEDPRKHLEEIKQVKSFESQNIITALELTDRDTVIDLGSGCGFIASNVAPKVKNIYCADISKSFIDYAKKITTDCHNIEYYQIPYGVLSTLPKVTAIYSVSVFIHFNLYDIYIYLLECYNRLHSNGRMLFDFLNDQLLDVGDLRWQRHADAYLKDKLRIFNVVHYNNVEAIKKIANEIGFTVDCTRNENDHTFVLLRK